MSTSVTSLIRTVELPTSSMHAKPSCSVTSNPSTLVAVLAGRGVSFLRFEGMDQDARGIWTAPGGDRVSWFTDPDGHVLSLTQPRR